MQAINELIDTIRFLLAKLERISADSVVAHRASGIRGSMLRALEQFEAGNPPPEAALQRMIAVGYVLLQKAAREIGPDRDTA